MKAKTDNITTGRDSHGCGDDLIDGGGSGSEVQPSQSIDACFVDSNVLQSSVETSSTRILIFTIPKPFTDPHIDCIQRNAISSWQSLGDSVDVLLIGDEPGVAEVAQEMGVEYHAEIDRNAFGTPLVSHAFHIAKSATDAQVLVYCNADVVLNCDFRNAIDQVIRSGLRDRFLAIGRRTNLDVVNQIDFTNGQAVDRLRHNAVESGEPAAIVCKEFFAFNRHLFDQIPDFAVGRGNWDNWMVAHSKSMGVPVIDFSPVVLTIHQNHDYQHLTGDCVGDFEADGENNRHIGRHGLRKRCYVSGPEALENQRLAGGKHVVSGSTSTYRLTSSGVVRNRLAWMNLDFWMDLPRFLRLVDRLFRD